jgi:hypothetical protein
MNRNEVDKIFDGINRLLLVIVSVILIVCVHKMDKLKKENTQLREDYIQLKTSIKP